MALTEIRVPQSNVNDTTAMVVSWAVEDGDFVAIGEELLVLETSKVSEEVTAPTKGFLRINAAAGTDVAVGGLLAWIAKDETEFPIVADQVESSINATARAKELAAELGIELKTIVARGIITEKHIRELSDMTVRLEGVPSKLVPLSHVQKVVLETVTRSTNEVAQAVLFGQADVTKAMATLESLVETEDIFISLTDLVMYVVSCVLFDFPHLNATLDGDSIRFYKEINIGATVEVENELYVINVHRANEISLIQVAEKRQEYIMALFKNTPIAGSLAGGTFTTTVLDQPAVQYQMPLIFPGQSGILGLGAVNDVEGQKNVGLSLSYDHRIVNGNYAARFLQKVADELTGFVFETPQL